MQSGLSFLIAARRAEIDELEQLARTSELVMAIGRLVHALQRERGLSNVLLASGGQRFAQQRSSQVAESLRQEQAVRAGFEALQTPARRNGPRLFSRVAWVLPGLDALPGLRRRVGALQVDTAAATAAYSKLIAGLLAVVFEAADGATDPEISRALAAMFNFMQGKEFAGQERACGAAAFTAGDIDSARQQGWLQLIAAQERCFRVFTDFAGPTLAEVWRQSQPAAEMAELERLRRVACAAPAGSSLDRELGTTWFDCCSLRIDAMQSVEECLTTELGMLCHHKTTAVRAEAEANESLLHQLPRDADASASAFFEEPAATADPPAMGAPGTPYGHQLGRSILEMLQDQSRRLQATSDELEAVRAVLNERKLVERAKGLLMAHRRLTEQEAHKMLRQTAMNQNRRIVDVAESVLAMAELLPASA